MTIPRFPKAATALAPTFSVLLVLSGCSGINPPVQTPQKLGDTPTILMVVPQTNGVGTNRAVAVVFSKPMDPSSISGGSFMVAGVMGVVAYDAANRIASFKPSADFAPNTMFNATITTDARDMSGTPMAAPFNFSFTTRATSDKSPPDIVAINVAAGATCVPLDQKISVTFDEQMDSLTINPSTFFIEGVAGTVTYNVLSQAATFTPSAMLAPNTTFTITVTTGAKDLGGVPLAAPFHQTFTTGPCAGGGVPPVALCPFIGNFSVLAGSTVTNTGSTVITGDVGVSPGTAVTGFPPGLASGAIHKADGLAAQAQTALATAYVDAAGRSGATTVAGDLVGKTFTSGVYKSTSSLALSGDVTLDAQGNPAAVFIFQISSTLTTGSGSHVVLANGANACNVFWQVGSSATLGTNSVFKGNILALTSITITTGVNLQGRALARNGAVTLDTNVIKGCTCP
jgi:Ice-binding-like/Bacterial Ig-like domain